MIVQFKIPDKYNITPLLAAIWENHVDCVKLLLSKVTLTILIILRMWIYKKRI